MTTSRNNERIRYRYGICLNDNCEKCKSKEVQVIPTRKEFVCSNPECGKPLRECPPPKKGGKTKLIGIFVAITALLAIAGGILFLGNGSSDKSQLQGMFTDTLATTDIEETVVPAKKDTVVITDTIVQCDTVKVEIPAKAKPIESKPSAPVTTSGSKDLGYATFKGSWPNDVSGRMTFKSSHIIDSRDPKSRVAEAGDYVIGEWSEGHLVQGIWYGADNQVKGSIIIGK